ncbi:MAG: polyprenyl synthetase family protein [Gemmataceae bacterium]|nr:polyprenyl synthetase family protein [Gemmataceae bacterium]
MTERQRRVDERLVQLVEREVPCPPPLRDAIRYSLLAPGKRLRPVLAFMACHAAGGPEDAAIAGACAVEMIHCYSLIHDDLPAMDDDDLRRGLPTCHKKFGEALAILAGDGLLTLAFQTLAQDLPPRSAAASCLELSKAAGIAGMVGGQAEDLGWERGDGSAKDPLFPRTEQPHSLEALENIHLLKTGALFGSCLQLGLIAAHCERSEGVDPQLRRSFDRYARNFGLVFQITDDLLDVEGSAEQTGKRVGKDAAHGKLTYPGFLGLAESRRRAQSLADETFADLRPLGERGEPLIELFRYVLTRDR